MKMNTTNRSFVLVESIDQSTHTVIPELDHATVQTGEDPWPFGVEGEALDSVTLRLELRQHDIFFPDHETETALHKPDQRERKEKRVIFIKLKSQTDLERTR